MKCCEFCLSEFHPRPQVKNPRACQRLECQKLRQIQNEKEWRSRNPDYPGEKYYEINRSQRRRHIRCVVQSMLRCFEVGGKLFGLQIIMEEFSQVLEGFLLGLGVRRINKFWSSTNMSSSDGLG